MPYQRWGGSLQSHHLNFTLPAEKIKEETSRKYTNALFSQKHRQCQKKLEAVVVVVAVEERERERKAIFFCQKLNFF